MSFHGVDTETVKHRYLTLNFARTLFSITKRIADVTIDLYAATACLSRASTALDKGIDSAEHEADLAAHFAAGAFLRVQSNLNELGGYAKSRDARVASISQDIFDRGAYVATHPVEL